MTLHSAFFLGGLMLISSSSLPRDCVTMLRRSYLSLASPERRGGTRRVTERVPAYCLLLYPFSLCFSSSLFKLLVAVGAGDIDFASACRNS